MPSPPAEVDITTDLVLALVQEQHPDLAGLDLQWLSRGWDNEIFRLGPHYTVRLPRRLASSVLTEHEHRWLLTLARDLPLAVPVPIRIGTAGCGYPWAWSVCPWLDGIELEQSPPSDWAAAGTALGAFLAVLHTPAPPDAPANPYRGVPLSQRAAPLADGLVALGQSVDQRAIARAWSRALEVEDWTAPPRWLHGDVHPLNVLVHRERLSAVIDFGDLTSGDPASDLAVGWMVPSLQFAPAFRDALGDPAAADDALWERARGWALALGVALAAGDDRVSGIGRRTLTAVLSDQS